MQDKFFYRNDFKLLPYIKATSGEFRFPKLKPDNFIPLALTPINKIKGDSLRELKTVHFFCNDFEFERVYKYPFRYLKVFKKYYGVIGTDFSGFLENRKFKALNIFNVFKNRLVDNFLQQNGVRVIPSVVFGSLDDFPWCCDGIPKNSTIAISSLGSLGQLTRSVFINCFKKTVEVLKPHTIIFIGTVPAELKQYQDIIIQYDSPMKSYIKLKEKNLLKKQKGVQ